ncbi:MAG TPA: FMN-binding negative transcriptional regulator [Acidobacteriaceae bacterium]|nr:FMN-binding negative transcriptional regulator [Acidobacteriaceae bacterium]
MFVRPCWLPTSPQDAVEIIDQNPWALLVSNGAEAPFATNLPLLLEQTGEAPRDGNTILVGHIARANEHARALALPNTKVLAIFEGPWSYVTASWYPKRDMPSTYYYTAVHCSGTIELQDEPALDASLEVLVQRSEASYPQGWRTDDIPRSEITRRFAGIVGFRIHVNRIEAKFKLGQDEPLQDALAVAENLERQASPADHAVAALIRKHNQDRTL